MLGLLRFAVTMSSRELPPVFRARPDRGADPGLQAPVALARFARRKASNPPQGLTGPGDYLR